MTTRLACRIVLNASAQSWEGEPRGEPSASAVPARLAVPESRKAIFVARQWILANTQNTTVEAFECNSGSNRAIPTRRASEGGVPTPRLAHGNPSSRVGRERRFGPSECRFLRELSRAGCRFTRSRARLQRARALDSAMVESASATTHYGHCSSACRLNNRNTMVFAISSLPQHLRMSAE